MPEPSEARPRGASSNALGERLLGTAKEWHEALNLRNLMNRFDVEGKVKGLLRPYRHPSSPSRNLDETRQLDELSRQQRAEQDRYE